MSLPNYLNFDSAWDYSEPEQTEARFREILLNTPEGHPSFLELLTQIARAQGLQGKFDKAHQTLDQVENRMGDHPSRTRVRYLLERGRVLNSSGKPEDSRTYFEQALDVATQLAEDSYAIDAIHMLAIVSPAASGLDLNLRAIKLAESSGQEKARDWLGSLYNNTGWSYHDMGDYPSALDMFQKAEAVRRAKGGVDQIRIAVWAVARALRSLKRVEEALSKQMALKAEIEQAGEVDGYVFEEIGECLLMLDRGEEAGPYFAQAHEVLSQDAWLAEKEPERLRRLKELSNES
jgi:tetratricopeptide (TPR) repeat protein